MIVTLNLFGTAGFGGDLETADHSYQAGKCFLVENPSQKMSEQGFKAGVFSVANSRA
jgi:hypothetical protein